MSASPSAPTPSMPKREANFQASLRKVLEADFSGLIKARVNYGESWYKYGGVGAFMNIARKWDRLHHYLSTVMKDAGKEWDVMEACRMDGRPEGTIDTIRDLRRYLALCEAKLIEEGFEHDALPKDLDDAPSARVLHPA